IGSAQFLDHRQGNLVLLHLSHYLKIISPPRLWSAGLDPPLIRQQLLEIAATQTMSACADCLKTLALRV
ncbi:MAG TPA: hypothetical protein V6D30_06730, partial [Leptolyngbyaceae cyanobacterium]